MGDMSGDTGQPILLLCFHHMYFCCRINTMNKNISEFLIFYSIDPCINTKFKGFCCISV